MALRALFWMCLCVWYVGAQEQYCKVASSGPPVSCVDKVHPTTGQSDCPRLAHLCNNNVYYNLMTQQCPKTCNRCTGCQDLVHPTTGVSNCAAVASYCKNPLYVNLMRQQCRKTCGYCT
ncbi:unnamed protein product [Heligmosomoides polygyrus]|uniref:ShTK domain protein n=1 Tax=Heligmosomoides polygyrus TaxID=6339 RepID=A0A183GIG5_HELPZ|nr:unnamed protein product [Heligmosomoides polygyrus]